MANSAPWLSWPSDLPADLHVTQVLRQERHLTALLGHGAAGPRGRLGLVGLPRHIAPIATDSRGMPLAAAFDSRPKDAIRVVLMGYELGVAQLGITPIAPPLGQPYGLAFDLGAWLWCDHFARTYSIQGPDAAARAQLAQVMQTAPAAVGAAGQVSFTPVVSDAAHAARLKRVLHHIAAGDIYQANLTRRLRLQGHLDPVATLRQIRSGNPVAHGAYVRTDGLELASASMETLLTYDPAGCLAASYPIKGTCQRSPEDPHAPARLLSDPKERAEHVMIVDLVRNDLGRVALPGSVQVPQLMTAEPYRGVWHGVSTVEARLAKHTSLGALAEAVFPGGSITGAPKRRAVALLQDIESEARGFYTGSLGYITPDGHMSLSILIRTLVHDARGWSLSVGGGIVADSTATREIAETWEKADVFRRLLAA